MKRNRDISKFDDVIDSREVIARIAELESEIEAEEISEDNGAEPQLDENENTIVDMVKCGTCGKSWNDALITERTPAPSARCPYESIHEEIDELRALIALQEEAEGYCSDWRHGETLIRDGYFQEYAQQLAEDIGAIKSDAGWPYDHIDWEAAADALKQDYTEVDFDGESYWIRS
jgi:hypothetical protein